MGPGNMSFNPAETIEVDRRCVGRGYHLETLCMNPPLKNAINIPHASRPSLVVDWMYTTLNLINFQEFEPGLLHARSPKLNQHAWTGIECWHTSSMSWFLYIKIRNSWICASSLCWGIRIPPNKLMHEQWWTNRCTRDWGEMSLVISIQNPGFLQDLHLGHSFLQVISPIAVVWLSYYVNPCRY